jgi:hypothetical protein
MICSTHRLNPLHAIPMALLLTVVVAPAASAETITTPLAEPLMVRGTSGGPQRSDCGFIAEEPSQVIRVTESFTSLQFTLESGGQPTLWITGPNGLNQCLMADDLSGGMIEFPGVWEGGNYSLFVGDRRGQSHRYTLTIVQE